MPRLNAANNFETTLASGIGTTDTSMTVNSSTGCPAVPFRATLYTNYDKANGEIVEVSNVNGTTWTIARAKEGTSAQEWSAGATVAVFGTAGMYNELLSSVEEDTTPKLGGNLDANDKIIGKPVIKDYGEEVKAHGTTGGSITCDMQDGNIHTITLNANTTFTFSNPTASGDACSFTLMLTQDSTARTVTFPASVKWEGGSAPDLSTVSILYILTFITVDGGTTWYGWLAGSDFS